jgi:hypothetical protein
MQFPAIPSRKVTVAERPDVAGVTSARAGDAAVPGVVRGQSVAGPTPPGPPPVDRRQGSRREGGDRRQRQIPVLLDTRTGRDRRGERRRTDDPPPPRVDEAV